MNRTVRRIRYAFLALTALALVAPATIAPTHAAPPTFQTTARQAVLIDFDTGAVLFEKNSDAPMFPASMSKIMTSVLVFDELRAGRLQLDSTFRVSEKAWRMGGSKMFVGVNDEIEIEDLLRGVIVQSGNDASIVIAEGIAGSEEAFAEQMTARATEIGLTGTQFRNATGWPDPEHFTTARDLAMLAMFLIREYPEFYGLYSEREFTYGKSLDGKPITQGNRNPLLYKAVGADGLKTGHTEAAGFGLTASAVRNDRRLVMVINGLNSVRARSSESERLLNWGFRVFDNYRLFEAGETVEEAKVWLGDAGFVPLVIEDALAVTIPKSSRRGMRVKVLYESPLPAPISAGVEVARIEVTAPDMEPISRPLKTAGEVGQLAFFGRITSAINFIIFGASSGG
ncbi:MAG: D-alanyl-D-alanine carboxypeptidase [Rhodospirillaceae bacterium]|jgi:serine-type D-Ala-D-Ala carboxypeptidase (penicillin-binding protein 5/6)|nr:D-alanyl-D-alanine carboxypeptidase [Rhodospirillaceae bacterium]MBT3930536.1 D-alanyl-D-alanine carboxypeptidase [Rhodospirillaceae bacterium]MBT4771394.1 D-alanyl-D-alanine carboxypeptidase [Rhodospirillaceae bacterium]MBT5359096.1 D-alanyl-D-alanine carboxypeptidase [Rhodospirillaceae bacterium]MBT7364647.1 D-alanyl-D-alanine carboxypeptidase [Rhodospirillaceae bacterium]